MTSCCPGIWSRLLGLALILAAVPCSRAASLSAGQAADLFSQGKQFFRQANDLAAKDPDKARDLYLKAAMRFERISSEGGVRNGKLYYDIGNAYFRMGDVGRAILYYRRAALFIRNDANLRQNLSYARSRRVDRIEEKQETKVLKTLFFWHYDLSSKVRLTLFTIFFAALFVVASVRLFVHRAGLVWLLVFCGGMAALLFGSLLAEEIAGARDISGVILSPEVVARKGDGETYQPSFKEPLHAGTEFKLIEDRKDWFWIELADGRRCWVPARTVGIVTQMPGSL